MSKAALSATVQAHILNRIRDTATVLFEQEPLKINKGGKEIFNPNSPVALEAIRVETNPAEEASMSRGGLSILASQFQKISDKSTIAESAVALLKNTTLFDNFAIYLLAKINKSDADSIRSTKEFDYTGSKSGARFATSRIEDTDKDVLLVDSITHGKFKGYFISFLQEQYPQALDTINYISKNIDTGHLSGVFNIKAQRVFGLKITQVERFNYRSLKATFKQSGDNSEELNNLFTKILVLLSDADYLSSNIVNNIELFSNTTKIIYDKNGPTASVELQVGILNQDIGRKLAAASGYLNKMLDAAKTKAMRGDAPTTAKNMLKFLESLQPLATAVNTAAIVASTAKLSAKAQKNISNILADNESIQNLLSTEGSTPILNAIGIAYGNTLAGKSIPNKETSKVSNKSKSSIKSKSTKNSTKPINNAVINKLRSSSSNPIRTTKGQFYSLASLQVLINTHLQDVISANMGNGSEKRILNYRTGRFATSANVERMSQSREGMITAFYRYQKNPYQTFEPGFKQGSPATRDPRLLIGKSIKEIAATMVGNRLRAVSV